MRLVLWMTPIVAFGITGDVQGESLDFFGCRRASVARCGGSAFDVRRPSSLAGLVLLTGLATQPRYPIGGAAAASRLAVARIGPRDAVLVTPPAMFSFTLNSGARCRLQPAP